LKVRSPLVASGYLKSKEILKVMWRDIRLVFVAKGFTQREGIDFI